LQSILNILTKVLSHHCLVYTYYTSFILSVSFKHTFNGRFPVIPG